MSMKLLKLGAAITTLGASCSFADTSDTDYSHYVNVGAGTFLSNVNVSDEGSDYYSGTGGAGGMIGIGFIKSPSFAWEINSLVGRYDVSDSGSSDEESDDPDYVYGALVGPAARWKGNFGNGFSIFSRLGLGVISGTSHYKDDTTKTTTLVLPYDGFGLGYQVSDRVDLSIEYNGLLLGVINMGLATANVTYRF